MAPALRDERVLRDRQIRIAGHRAHEADELLEPLGDATVIEEVARVDDTQVRRGSVRPDVDREIELRLALEAVLANAVERPDRHVGAPDVGLVEEDLHERHAAQIADWLQIGDELIERQILVRDCRQRRAARPAEQLAERRVVREVVPDDDRVDEQPDERLDLEPPAVGDRNADGDVRASGQPGDEHLEDGQERDEDRGAFDVAERAHTGDEIDRQIEVARRGRRREARRPLAIGRQLQGREALQRRVPVRELAGELVALERLALPRDVVDELHGQRRQRRLAAVGERSVDRRQLVEQHLPRPCVAGDVMERHEQHVPAIALADQARAQQTVALEVERRVLQPRRLAPNGRRRIAPALEVDDRQVERRRLPHDLPRGRRAAPRSSCEAPSAA